MKVKVRDNLPKHPQPNQPYKGARGPNLLAPDWLEWLKGNALAGKILQKFEREGQAVCL